jgi:hypothetical protein
MVSSITPGSLSQLTEEEEVLLQSVVVAGEGGGKLEGQSFFCCGLVYIPSLNV